MPGGNELRIPFEIGLGADELRLVFLLRRLRLIERRLIWTRVDLQERVSSPDLLALLEIDFDNLAVDPALDRDGVVGLDRADAEQKHRHIRDGDGSGRDRDARRRRLCRRRRHIGAEAHSPYARRGSERDDRSYADRTPYRRAPPYPAKQLSFYHRQSL